MADLYINLVDAWGEYGVKMGEGFINALLTPADYKEWVVNSSRLDNGDRYVPQVNETGQAIPPNVASRQVTLQFVIMGKGETIADRRNNLISARARFLDLLRSGEGISIQVPAVSSDVFRLMCVAKSSTYAQNKARTLCKISVKFVEPNPMNRGSKNVPDA